MTVVDDIRRVGFRRWYERQLTESFAYLVTAFLTLILLLAGIEALGQIKRSPSFYALLLGGVAACGVVVYVAWRRFNVLLLRAERFANDATCPQCSAWGRFDVIGAEASPADEPVEAGRPHWLRVCCKRCGKDWRIG
jgi:hypothetical protein